MIKVLVVDDSTGWLSFHKNALEEIYGQEIDVDCSISARNGYDMVYNNMAEPYDLIISDLQMESDFAPQLAGEWFVEQVKLLSAYRKTAIIIMSGSINIDMVANSLNVAYLRKSTAARDLNSYKLALDEILK